MENPAQAAALAHSRLGVASVAAGSMAIITLILLFTGANWLDGDGWVYCFQASVALTLIALVLGVIGLFKQGSRKRFAVLGTVLAVLLTLAIGAGVIFFILSWAYSAPAPSHLGQ